MFGAAGGSGAGRLGRRNRRGPGLRSGSHSTPASPTLRDLAVTVPLPAGVRNLSEVRPSKGDATYSPGDRSWNGISQPRRLPLASLISARCTVVGQLSDENQDADPSGLGFNTKDYSYDEPYQTASPSKPTEKETAEGDKDERKAEQNKILMPSSASVSFTVKGGYRAASKSRAS